MVLSISGTQQVYFDSIIVVGLELQEIKNLGQERSHPSRLLYLRKTTSKKACERGYVMESMIGKLIKEQQRVPSK